LDDVEGAAFFLQQALEKYLKAYLLGRGWKLRKIHLLHVLLEDALAYEGSLGVFRDLCERVAGYYFTERYPQLVPSGLQPSDLERDREEGRRLIEALFPDEVRS
jgi:HEPN domain-containing protein